ncbi:hypothetical protein F2P56_032383 [Juglans regia]|uniref:Acyl-coenzyme A thioesterase 13-like n=1 Tax=Juglans regia TaxID=51240 RepID=A0A833TUD3_JUGRE|nr:hypothetical protein F2P56_032383 [Juglans regia]
MDKAREFLELTKEESDSVSGLTIHPHRPGLDWSFYEDFSLRGIRLDRVEPGFVACTFKVPPRLAVRFRTPHSAIHGKLQDELEITSRVLGKKGGYAGTIVLMRNKATGDIIAEGRHSLFGRHASKL